VDCCFFEQALLVEATLAQIYKEKHLGEFRGGPAFYIERISVKWFAVLFAVVSIISVIAAWSSSELCCRWNTECL
jgi:Na+/alanine symporter